MIEIIRSQARFSFAHAHTHTHYSPICMFRFFSAQCTSSVPSSSLIESQIFFVDFCGRKIPITTCARARTTNPRPPVLPPTAQSQWTAAPGGSPRCGRSRRSGPPGCCPRARPRGRLRWPTSPVDTNKVGLLRRGWKFGKRLMKIHWKVMQYRTF